MLIDDVIRFLKELPPFNLLDEEAMARLAGAISLEYYPKGFPILTQGGPPSDSLQIVVTGSAKVAFDPGGGAEVVIDYRSEGDAIGFLSLYSGDHSRTNVTALEETTCYLIPRATAIELLDANPGVREYLHRTFLAKYVDKAFTDMRNRSLLASGGEKLLFTTPVGELATRNVITAPRGISIQEAAAIMSRHRIASLVLTDADGAPAGIVTDRDLRDKVAARGRDAREPVTGIMTTALIKADAMDYCFEALLKMIRHNIHHLLVVDHGRLTGIVANHDLMLLQGTSPISVVREIETQQDEAGLAAAAGKVDGIVSLLLKDGARAGNIMHIVAELDDRIVRKATAFVERRLGPAPLPWAWLECGSGGRKERAFRTDQDNALVHADPATPAEEAAARAWFPRFAAAVCEELERCGFAACPAHYMASNPAWNRPLGSWKSLVERWIGTPTPEAVLHAVTIFDFRFVAGEAALAAELRGHLAQSLRGQNVFLARLAAAALRQGPALGFFGTFAVEKSGPHRNRLNLKLGGLGPIVDLARICALEAGIPESPTVERLRALGQGHPLVARYGDELVAAFEFLALLRLHHQAEQLRAGLPQDSYVDPAELGALERKSLKDAFRLILRAQELLTEQYRAGLVRS